MAELYSMEEKTRVRRVLQAEVYSGPQPTAEHEGVCLGGLPPVKSVKVDNTEDAS